MSGTPDRFPGYDGLDHTVLRRYVTGQSDPAERRRIEAWAAEGADRRAYLDAMRELFDRDPADRTEAAALWERIAARMEPPATPSTPPYEAPWDADAVRVDLRRRRPRVLAGAFSGRNGWRSGLAAAAAIVGLAVAGGVLFSRERHATAAAAAPADGMRQVATARGQRAEIQLGDGTRVVLGVASRLRFAPTLGSDRGPRDVYLEGAAYFEVVHNESRPFLVHTANAVAEDIGTAFVVTAYPETQSTQVVVAEGAVAFGGPNTPVASKLLLTRGHLGRLAGPDGALTTLAVDPALYTAWTRGELAFRDAPLADVVDELRRWYDVDVRIDAPALRTLPFTASFAAESFGGALDVITAVLPVRAERHGKVVTLYAR